MAATVQEVLSAERAVHEAEFNDFPDLIRNLMTAHKLGRLDGHSECVDLLTDISACLKNGSRRGRELSRSSKIFYGMLLNNSSPWAHKFVSGVLFGPDLRTTQKARAAFETGLTNLGITTDSLKNLKEIHLSQYGLEDVPGIVSEDATVSHRRLDSELVEQIVENTPAAVWKTGVKLWGLATKLKPNGEQQLPVVFSADELRKVFQDCSLAGYVYVYVWIPILPGAPWFPFAIVATDNKFDNQVGLAISNLSWAP